LHTNLGRSPISKELLQKMTEELSGYCSLEWDCETTERGSRTTTLEKSLELLLGSQYGSVCVNNNAATLILILNTFAKNKEVIVSRGELVQIGGGFRVSEIIEASGCKLVEVGSTNITSLEDYKNHINENTAFILKVHHSNFYIEGHTESPSLNDLISLSKKTTVPLLMDMGGGKLTHKDIGEDESVDNLLEKGVDIVCFSGDKLLGGPQAGLILAKKEVAQKLKKSPLYRALRLGKFDLFLLENILLNKINNKKNALELLYQQTSEEIKSRTEKFAETLKVPYKIIKGISPVGGGTMPNKGLETYLLVIENPSAEKIARKLAQNIPPIVVRKESKAITLDFRTISESEEEILHEALEAVL
jgi:L-seryl-tRNA(Ser) seleniumtransferase